MASEVLAVTLAALLMNPAAPKQLTDGEVTKLFDVPAAQAKVGATTRWVDVTRQVGHTHSLWMQKTGENRWEMRGAM